jgi:hypothetical protein
LVYLLPGHSLFGTAQDEHLELRGGHIEPLEDVLANPMLETAAAWAGLVIDINGDLFARQMRRQRAAKMVRWTGRWRREVGWNAIASARHACAEIDRFGDKCGEWLEFQLALRNPISFDEQRCATVSIAPERLGPDARQWD